MKKIFSNINAIFIFFLILAIIFSHVYCRLLSDYIALWLYIIFEIFFIIFLLFISQKLFLQSQKNFINAIKKIFPDIKLTELLNNNTSSEIFSTEILSKILAHQQSQEKKQQALMEKLRNSNVLLERSNKITSSIIQITYKILSSGEIDEVLQTILEKAIEIIPTAQKGSILIYNGSYLAFKASYGYDFEALKNLKFNIEEILQYNSEDFYEPHIITSSLNFSREHLEADKYEVLQKCIGLNLKSILSCTIQIDNNFYGIINLDNTEDENAFNNEDKLLIKHLSTQIGIALKNAALIEKTLYLSRHDSLTGIYNRCYFEELLMQTLHVCKASGSVFSLALLDLNELKSINDTYGHEAGDLLLRKFAQGVNENMLPDDIFARYGGDEFAVIFTNKNRIQAEIRIQSIRAAFANSSFTYCGKVITKLNFGCGIAEFPADASEFQELLKLADTRMYKDKKERKKPIK